MWRWFVFQTCLCLTSRMCCEPLTPNQEDDLREFIQTTMDCRRNAAMTVALVRNGQTIFAEGFGLRDVDNSLPMTATTRISIGSLTKAFTSSLCADAVADGLVTWDAPLRDVLGPDFGMEGDFRSEQLSLRDALAHKIGVPTYWGVSTAALGVTRQELCMQRLKHFPTLYDFRSRYKYSNYPYVLAGYVHEVVTGKPWDDSVNSSLFEPLGMLESRAASQMSPPDWEDTAFSYTLQDGLFVRNPEQDQMPFLMELDPAAGIFSSAVDMGQWLKFQLNLGQSDSGSEVVPSEELEDTHQAAFAIGRESPRVQRPDFPVDDMSLTRSLGWVNGMYRGHEKLHHTGSYSSYNCRLTLLPGAEVGVFACVNSPGDYRGSRAVHTVNTYALDLLLDEEPWLNTTTTCTYPDPWRARNKPSQSVPRSRVDIRTSAERQDVMAMTAQNADYVGNYSHPAFGTFNIFQNSTDLSLFYEFGVLLSGDVNPSGTEDMYYMTLNYPINYRMVFFPEFPDGFPLYFTRDADTGSVISVQVDYLEFDLPPVFVK